MTQVIRSNFQDHPFHLVSPSPWPFYTSLSLFTLTTSGALSMHNFSEAYNVFFIALITVIASMSFWFRDIIAEGRDYIHESLILNTASAISTQDLELALERYNNIHSTCPRRGLDSYKNNPEKLSYYLSGLLEGDGHISIPFLGNTTLNRILNPRIVFTSHINNLGFYAFIQSELGGIGRFQSSGNNTIRYIIGDKVGILFIINLIHGKLRTPKNITFNKLIEFFNNKYSLTISESSLDESDFSVNSWLAGFTEADGHFGIKYRPRQDKPETSKRSSRACWSGGLESVSLRFRLDQRLYDKPTSSSMEPFMLKLALFFQTNLKSYNSNNTKSEVLSIYVSSIKDISLIVNYFDKYPLLGEKYNDYVKWTTVYNMIVSKEHLTEEGRLKIREIIGKLD